MLNADEETLPDRVARQAAEGLASLREAFCREHSALADSHGPVLRCFPLELAALAGGAGWEARELVALIPSEEGNKNFTPEQVRANFIYRDLAIRVDYRQACGREEARG